jgi:diguanylate cyclase (GGDEF)-like protein
VSAALATMTLRALIVDDNEADRELCIAALRRYGMSVEWVAAEGEAELRAALRDFVPDVVLCDFSFPDFDGFAARRIVYEAYPECPLIFVSGAISEERAAIALQCGAVDYVMKSTLVRLPIAVERAVAAARASADVATRARWHVKRLERLWGIANDPALAGTQLANAMLLRASLDLRAHQSFRGYLCRAVGDAAAIVECSARTGEAREPALELRALRALGARGTRADARTSSWADTARDTDAPPELAAAGWHSAICTSFESGNSRYWLAFAATDPSEMFGDDDYAYLDALATFFSNYVEQRWREERRDYEQRHDGLTGLVDRPQFHVLAAAASKRFEGFAILIFDLAAFHEINDAYGYAIGDAVLIDVATSLAVRARHDEFVARVGADVFAVFVPCTTREIGRERLADFASAFAHPFSSSDLAADTEIARPARVGVAMAPDDGAAFEEIYARAEAALSVARERGLGSTVFYEAGMDREAQQRATLLSEIAEGLARDQFTLYYQPHIELASGRVTGCEALIRWNHPVRGLVFPGDFIPFAEETGAIASIDDWVMDHAFSAAADLSGDRPEFRLYFNLSGRQAGNPSVVRAFANAARAGVPLKRIGVEITETDAMRDVHATRRVLRALRRLDVHVAIDDFGTGFSSLSSLKQFPVDIVKIDRTFVSGVTSNPDDAAIAETIISIADHFGFASLGEGAETPEEVAWLRSHGCRYVQGYAIGYPLPIDKFKAWLADHDARTLAARLAETKRERRHGDRRKVKSATAI